MPLGMSAKGALGRPARALSPDCPEPCAMALIAAPVPDCTWAGVWRLPTNSAKHRRFFLSASCQKDIPGSDENAAAT
jgi:hypothetical protein